ncbi:YegP family protein [Sodalis sp. RH21]|uniref:YegP family protein n=1 Tax=unclassified Sodalis (in: enterobacteria) TaxID=2636512 RepID=UPI0039B3D581
MATVHYELEKVRNGHFIFKLKGVNGEIILASATFCSKASAENAINFARYNAPDENNYELKHSGNNQPYFILRGKNYQVLGQSGPYQSETAAKRGIKAAMECAATQEIMDLTV